MLNSHYADLCCNFLNIHPILEPANLRVMVFEQHKCCLPIDNDLDCCPIADFADFYELCSQIVAWQAKRDYYRAESFVWQHSDLAHSAKSYFMAHKAKEVAARYVKRLDEFFNEVREAQTYW